MKEIFIAVFTALIVTGAFLIMPVLGRSEAAVITSPLIDPATVSVTTDASGFATVKHSLGVVPKAVTVTAKAPISGTKTAFQVMADSYTSTTFRVRILTPSAGIYVGTATIAYVAIGEKPVVTASGYYTEPTTTVGFDAYESLIGKKPEAVMWYWQLPWGFPKERTSEIVARGQMPILTLGTEGYTNAQVAGGALDSVIDQFITDAQAVAGTVWLRYGWEMNGTWYNWSDRDFVSAWKHVQDKFRARNTTNVKWVWSPNVVDAGFIPLAEMFPGNDRVDVVALDGYNRGTSESWSTWKTFSEVFGDSVNQVKALAPGKPLWVGETASSELGGNKAAWISDMYVQLRNYGFSLFVWFNLNKETDWRVNSSPEALAAFKAG